MLNKVEPQTIEAVCTLSFVRHNNRDAACYDQHLMFGQSQGLECVCPPETLAPRLSDTIKRIFQPHVDYPESVRGSIKCSLFMKDKKSSYNPSLCLRLH